MNMYDSFVLIYLWEIKKKKRKQINFVQQQANCIYP